MPVPDHLAARLTDLARQLDELVDARDQAIVEAREAGGSLREIAELVGLSHQQVKLITDRRTAAADQKGHP